MTGNTRLISTEPASPNEESVERALRPQRLAEYVGQLKIREQLEIFVSAARNRGEALDHVLLFGPPGLARPRWRISSRMRWRQPARHQRPGTGARG